MFREIFDFRSDRDSQWLGAGRNNATVPGLKGLYVGPYMT